MSRLILTISFLLPCLYVLANPLDNHFDFNLNKKAGLAFQHFNQTILDLDTAEALPFFRQTIKEVKRNDQEAKHALLLGFKGVYYYHQIPQHRDSSIKYLKTALKILEKSSQYNEIKARFNNILGYYLFRHLNYQAALEKMLISDYQFRKLGYKNISGIDLYLYNTAVVYFGFKQYDKAIEYLNRSLEYTDSFNLESLEANYNLLGVCYSEQGEKEVALDYLKKSRELIIKDGDSATLTMVDCNMGMFYSQLNQYDKAKIHLQNAYENGLKYQHYLNAATAALWRTKNALNQKDVNDAVIRLKEAKSTFSLLERISPENKKMIYSLEAEIADIQGIYRIASLYKDSVELMNNQIGKMKDLASLADLNVQLIREKHESEMELLEQQTAHQKARQKLILVISTLIALFLLHLWIQTNRKRKKERHEFEEERSKSIEQLNGFRQRIREKNELLEKVKDELQQKNELQIENEAKSKVIQQLSDAIILTEDDWIQFKRLFEQVYPNFLPKIKEEFPELTLAEIRFLALLKMGLNVTEMANTLAILPQSVRKTRQRLMKKLSLSHQKELRQFIANI